MEWLTVEVFDSDAAAWWWRDRYADVLVTAAITAGALSWEWHAHGYGVVLEVCLPDAAAVEVFRALPAVGAALEAAPDPVNGVLVYRGRGGGAGTGVPRRPRPHLGAGAVALPEPDDIPHLPAASRPSFSSPAEDPRAVSAMVLALNPMCPQWVRHMARDRVGIIAALLVLCGEQPCPLRTPMAPGPPSPKRGRARLGKPEAAR